MKYKSLLVSFFLTLTINVNSQTSAIPTVQSMTDDQLWEALLSPDLQGNTIFDKCLMTDNRLCATCACDYYFRANSPGSYKMYGWPKNPASGDSTGCNNGRRWGGYTLAMATPNLKANARAMLLHALNANVCGTYTPPSTSTSIAMDDSAKFKFANPSANGGKVLCGTTHLGPQQPNVIQFTELPENFCLSAYYSALKGAAKNDTTLPHLTNAEWLAYKEGTDIILGIVDEARILNQNIPFLMNSAVTPSVSGVTIFSPQELIDANLVDDPSKTQYTLLEKRALLDAIELAGEPVFVTNKVTLPIAVENTIAKRAILYPTETVRQTAYQTMEQDVIPPREIQSVSEAYTILKEPIQAPIQAPIQ